MKQRNDEQEGGDEREGNGEVRAALQLFAGVKNSVCPYIGRVCLVL